jgi:hypothetical protein
MASPEVLIKILPLDLEPILAALFLEILRDIQARLDSGAPD